MTFFAKLWKMILNLLEGTKKQKYIKESEPQREAEIIRPIRFKYSIEEEESTRTEEESLKLFDAYLKSDKEKRQKVAKTTRDILIQKNILEEKDMDILPHLISNIWFDEELQYRILEEETFGEEIKCWLAKRPALSLDIQKVLSKDPNPGVKKILVRWQRPVNPAVAKILVEDPDEEIRKSLASTIGESIKVENVFCFKDKGEDIQKILIQDKSPEVRGCLAGNKNINKEVQIALAEKCIKNGEWQNLKMLSENNSITLECEELILKLMGNTRLSFYKGAVVKSLRENKSLIQKRKTC